jgi:hypothetical protein
VRVHQEHIRISSLLGFFPLALFGLFVCHLRVLGRVLFLSQHRNCALQ